jgi:hypothetical protein
LHPHGIQALHFTLQELKEMESFPSPESPQINVLGGWSQSQSSTSSLPSIIATTIT